jgi:hypothetical protein
MQHRCGWLFPVRARALGLPPWVAPVALAGLVVLGVIAGCPLSESQLQQIREIIANEAVDATEAEQIAQHVFDDGIQSGRAVGPQGPEGDEGPAGPQGPAGPAGPGMSFVVFAGGAQTVSPGDQVTLDGSGTKPQSGSKYTTADLTYEWEQVDESGITVTLTDADKREAKFTVPAEERTYLLEFRLTVTDPDGVFAIDEVIILVLSKVASGVQVGDVPLVGGSAELEDDHGTLKISVSVQDTNGDLIQTGLSTGNFKFRKVTLTPVGGAAVSVTSATVTDITVVPPSSGGAVTSVLDFDSSGSMSWNDPGATGRKAGGEAFFNVLDGNDYTAILDFGAGANSGFTDSRLLQDFTNDVNLLRAALNQLTEDDGTPLWDSGLDGLTQLGKRVTTGGVLVLLTDGENNQSANTADDLIAAAKARSTPVYTVGLGDSLDFSELQRVASETGGAFAEASDANALAQAFGQIGTGVTVGYIIVEGAVTYPAQAPGNYTVAGELVTTVGGKSVVTAFNFTAQIL